MVRTHTHHTPHMFHTATNPLCRHRHCRHCQLMSFPSVMMCTLDAPLTVSLVAVQCSVASSVCSTACIHNHCHHGDQDCLLHSSTALHSIWAIAGETQSHHVSCAVFCLVGQKSQHYSLVLTSGTRAPDQVIHVLPHHASSVAPPCTCHVAAGGQRSTCKCEAQKGGGVYE